MYPRVVVLFTVLGLALSSDHLQYPDVPPKYDYNYAIIDDQTLNDYGHQETRDGGITTGKYYVALPDGRLQVVTYTSDEGGYSPIVSYDGEIHAHDYTPPHAHVPQAHVPHAHVPHAHVPPPPPAFVPYHGSHHGQPLPYYR
ncbi:Pro-resilin-like 114 [Homarus americanus]|uniref:Pro-resilin-like 114 n=1 Tax=Homarus americanus TaxID=6706 RepID=A0A8J5MY95_HOMAM|nr:Pro-resilin-like 114 [Homarus americanus]